MRHITPPLPLPLPPIPPTSLPSSTMCIFSPCLYSPPIDCIPFLVSLHSYHLPTIVFHLQAPRLPLSPIIPPPAIPTPPIFNWVHLSVLIDHRYITYHYVWRPYAWKVILIVKRSCIHCVESHNKMVGGHRDRVVCHINVFGGHCLGLWVIVTCQRVICMVLEAISTCWAAIGVGLYAILTCWGVV